MPNHVVTAVPAGAGDEYWRDQGLRLQCAKVLHVYPYSDGPRSAHAPGNTPTERFAERVEQEYFERQLATPLVEVPVVVPPQELHCVTNTIGMFTYTDCY